MGLVTGPHVRFPVPTENGQRAPAACPKDGQLEEGKCPTSNTPHGGMRHPPGRAPLCRPQKRSKPARKGVHCLVGDGSTHRHPPRPRKTDSGPRPPAPRTGGSGRESARPRTPLTEAGVAPPSPPRAPLCRPHSAQSQLARPCAVGLVVTPGSPIVLVMLFRTYDMNTGRVHYHDLERDVQNVARLPPTDESCIRLFPFEDCAHLIRHLVTLK